MTGGRDRKDELECGCPPGRCSAKLGGDLLRAAAAVLVAGLVILLAYLIGGGMPWTG